jgi:hypothetical protein
VHLPHKKEKPIKKNKNKEGKTANSSQTHANDLPLPTRY